MDRQGALQRLKRHIEHGTALISHAHRNDPDSVLVVIGPDWIKDREFAEWRTDCLNTLTRVARDNDHLTEEVSRFRKLPAQPGGRDKGVGILQGVMAGLESGALSFNSDEAAATPTDQVLEILRRFHRFSVAMQRPRRNDKDNPRPNYAVRDEYDVQHLLLALLKASFDDVRQEEWTPSYAGKSSRMDFLLFGLESVIETKMTRDGLGEKEVGEELIVDKERYRNHKRCKRLICLIYDPEHRIANPVGLENDLREDSPFEVRVIVIPKA